MTDQKIDPEPPTLAARPTDDVCDAAHVAYERVLNFDAAKHPDWDSLRAAASTAMRAVLVAALTPEPVTPIGGGSQGHELNRCGGCGGRGSEPLRDGLCQRCWRTHPALREPPEPVTPSPSAPAETWQPIDTAPKNKLVLVALIKDDKIWRVSDAKFNGLGWYTRSGEACHWRTHWAFMPSWWPHGVPTESVAPASPSAPTVGSREDDGRGLAVDMIDVDRLREFAKDHPFGWWKEFADRLATTITEIGSLRESLREAIERCREQVKRTDVAEEELATCCLCEYEFDVPHTPQDRSRQVVCAKCWPHDADARGWQAKAKAAEQERDAREREGEDGEQ